MLFSWLRRPSSPTMYRKPGRTRLGLHSLEDRSVPAVIATATLDLSNDSINENLWTGALIGTFSPHIPGAAGYTSYQLVSGAGDTNNGAVYVAGNQVRATQRFDHEALASLSFRVKATALNGVNSEEQFTIAINNVNERPGAPSVSGQSVPENSPVGTLVGLLSATDPDVGDSITYSLINNGNGQFQVNGNRLEVAPGANLNFEIQQNFYVRVKATDLGGKSSYRGFLVNVTNENEAPTGLELYSSTVAENSPVGTFVGTLAAVDPDFGAPTLSLLDNAGGRFRITGTSLEVNGAIDFEAAPSYNVTVRAQDVGGMFRDRTFTINVVNVNEAPTNLTLSNSSVSLPNPQGTLVGLLNATDPDAGASIGYTLTNNAVGKFQINGNRLEIADPSQFQWNKQPSYQVEVLAQDQFGGGVTNTFTIVVSAAIYAPSDIFLNGDTISENSQVGQYVGYVSATDPDSHVHPTLTLIDNAGSRFALVGQQLQVNNSALLNFENASSHQVTIRATDAELQFIDRTFTINVTNVNETPTSLVLAAAPLTVPTTAGLIVGTLSALDPDGPGGLIYILTNNASGKFQLVNGNQIAVADPALIAMDPQATYNIGVLVLDPMGGVFEQSFTINVVQAV